jgi:uncharacterized SAM-binding protein YcdF (DUF218 family)
VSVRPARRVLCALGLATLALFAATAFTPLANAAHRALAVRPQIERADAIVVLGAGVSTTGNLSDSSLRRAVHGVELEHRALAPTLVMLGPSEWPLGEAEIRGMLARSLGVPLDRLLLVKGGRTTREEAQRTRDALPPGSRRILLVTGSLHMTRARALFERAGFTVLPAPVDDTSGGGVSPEARLMLSLRIGEELLARLYHRVAGYV